MLNNIILSVTIDKFYFNLVLVNINKLKLYRFVEDQTLQSNLIKFNNLLLKKSIDINNYGNMFIKETSCD